MKQIFSLLLVLTLSVSIVACGNSEGSKASEGEAAETSTDTQMVKQDSEESDSGAKSTEAETGNSQTDIKQEDGNTMKMNIQIGNEKLTATLVQNSSAEALVEMLSEGPLTIDMNDYAGMEKVGPFPESLPRNDEQISTDAGDLILYQGNSFVIYYDKNSWDFTRLGKVDNVSKQKLKDILGSGSVTAVLSLAE